MARRWLPPAHPTPFQALIMDFMRAHWPMDLAGLADYLQMPATTVHGWFYGDGRVPHASTLRHVALMTGIPLDELLRAAGYDVPEPDGHALALPPVSLAAVAPLWDYLEQQVQALPTEDVSPRARHDLIEQIHNWRAGRFEQFALQREAEHRAPTPSANDVTKEASADADTTTTAQHERPKQATRSRPRRKRDSVRRAPSSIQ